MRVSFTLFFLFFYWLENSLDGSKLKEMFISGWEWLVCFFYVAASIKIEVKLNHVLKKVLLSFQYFPPKLLVLFTQIVFNMISVFLLLPKSKTQEM